MVQPSQLPAIQQLDLVTPLQNYQAIKNNQQNMDLKSAQIDLEKQKLANYQAQAPAQAKNAQLDMKLKSLATDKQFQDFGASLIARINPDSKDFDQQIAGVATDYEHALVTKYGFQPAEAEDTIKRIMASGATTPDAIRQQQVKLGLRPAQKQQVVDGNLVTIQGNNVSAQPIPGLPGPEPKQQIVNGQLVTIQNGKAVASNIPGLQVNPEQQKPQSSIGKLNQDLKNGLISKEDYQAQMANLTGQANLTSDPKLVGLTGEDVLKNIDKETANQVQALAEGRMAFPAGFALKSPYWQKMISLVGQYDPTFDQANFNSRVSTRKDFTSGKSAQQLNALNTVAGHLDTLLKSAESLDNSSFTTYNTIGNYIENKLGDPKVKKFNTARKAVADELTRVWRGTGGSEQDIKTWGEQLDSSGSPEQLHAVLGQIAELVKSKIDSLGEQYSQGMGTTKYPIQIVTPKAKQTFEKIFEKAGMPQEDIKDSVSARSAITPQVPAQNSQGWTLHEDANGNKAYVSPDGKQFEEVK